MRSFLTYTLSPTIIGIIRSMRMRWTGHVARMGEKRNSYRVLVGKSEGNSPVGYIEVSGRMILKWILQK
jgi:hypothetical protein